MSEGDVAVVGGGIAGLLLAYNLRSEATVFEAGAFGSRGRRCPGIISAETLERLPGALKYAQQFYDSLSFIIPELSLRVEVYSKRPFACKIDRSRHEEWLSSELENRGVKLVSRTRVDSVKPVEKSVKVSWSKGERFYGAVVLAEGYPPVLSKKLGLAQPVDARIGLFTSAHLRGECDVNKLQVVYSPRTLKGFSWLAPLDDGRAVVGVVTEVGCDAFKTLTNSKKMFTKVGVDMELVGEPRGGYVLRGYTRTLGRGRVFAFGDAAAMVKSLSGGGLYGISVAAEPVALMVDAVASGDAPSREVIREVRKTLIRLYKGFLLAKRFDGALQTIPPLGVKLDSRVHRLEYDLHEVSLAQILTGVSKLTLKFPQPRIQEGN